MEHIVPQKIDDAGEPYYQEINQFSPNLQLVGQIYHSKREINEKSFNVLCSRKCCNMKILEKSATSKDSLWNQQDKMLYDENSSLLYLFETPELLEWEPSRIVKYQVTVALAKDNSASVTGLLQKDAKLTDCLFYVSLLARNPKQIYVINCYGTGCPTGIPPRKDAKSILSASPIENLWCISCHGRIDDLRANAMESFVKKSLSFQEIPQRSILRIKKYYKDIDYQNKHHVEILKTYMENDIKKCIEMQCIIDRFQNSIEKILQKYNSYEELEKNIEQFNNQIKKENFFKN